MNVSAFFNIVFASYTPFELDALEAWANECERLANLMRRAGKEVRL